MTKAAPGWRPPLRTWPPLRTCLRPGPPLWPGPKLSWDPAPRFSPAPSLMRPGAPLFAGPQVCCGGGAWGPAPRFRRAPNHLRPGAPLSPGLKSEGYEARLPAFAGPHVPMRPGAPLSPGLTEKTRHQPAWLTSGCELSRRSFWTVGRLRLTRPRAWGGGLRTGVRRAVTGRSAPVRPPGQGCPLGQCGWQMRRPKAR
jgi:hypothetical protein